MVPRTLSKRIWGVIRLMFRMFKLLTIAVILFGAVALIGCSQVPKELEGEKLLVKENKLKALDKFWDLLGSGKNSTGVE